MTEEKRTELIRLLETELDFIEGGGYGSPAGHPDEERPLFFESPSCINHWLVPGHKEGCHDDCIFMGVVPERHKGEKMPCHFIPLNAVGDTVNSLERRGSRERLEEAVKEWLRTTISQLKAGADPLRTADVKY
jgi:hypothetical protein